MSRQCDFKITDLRHLMPNGFWIKNFSDISSNHNFKKILIYITKACEDCLSGVSESFDKFHQ